MKVAFNIRSYKRCSSLIQFKSHCIPAHSVYKMSLSQKLISEYSSRPWATRAATMTNIPSKDEDDNGIRYQSTPSASSVSSSNEDEAKKLFDFDSSHIPTLKAVDTLKLCLYFPFGVILAIFRACLWIAGALIDSQYFKQPAVASGFLRLLGFRAHWQNVDRIPKGRHIMVTNHVTPGDLLALFEGLPQRYVHLITTGMPSQVTLTKNLPLLLKYATPEVVEQLAVEPVIENNIELPVHIHPEGGLTNGRWGMMQFSRGFTKMLRSGDWVVPVALKAVTPWGIRTHTLLSSFPVNFFWLSFCPWINITATVLHPVQQQPDEPRAIFVKRVQQSIADELGLIISECTISAKKRIMQRETAKRQCRKV